MTQTFSAADTPQTSTDQLELRAWQTFLRAHCTLARTLDATLRETHGLTITDYDVITQLAGAAGNQLRMSELAERVLLTRSGITRLVDGLTRDGFVERVSCPTDARVSYAQLTPAGEDLHTRARSTHRAGIHEAFGQYFDAAGLQQLETLLGQLPQGDNAVCCGGDEAA